MILVRDADHACEVTDQIAPEHLHIATAEPRSLLSKFEMPVRRSWGHSRQWLLVIMQAGPSHVLPTGGYGTMGIGLVEQLVFAGGKCDRIRRASFGADRSGDSAHGRQRGTDGTSRECGCASFFWEEVGSRRCSSGFAKTCDR